MTKPTATKDTSQFNEEILNFFFKENYKSVLTYQLKRKLFIGLTNNSSALFLRGKDIISINPQITGIHEPVLTGLINHFCQSGYQDFLIDIGANIGLTSCQNGNSFKQVHMFEPNPYCCKILEVNSMIALNKTTYRIYNFGLGNENTKTLLTVPRHNWGGAFIKDAVNSYDEKILAGKDDFKSLIGSNYFEVEIEIHDTVTELGNLFKKLSEANLKRGVIKIDVEGYEPPILKGIAKAIPKDLKAVIIFESWNPDFDMNDILNAFNGNATAYKLVRHTPWKKSWPDFLKAIAFLFKPSFSNRLEVNDSGDWSGDLVLKIN